LLSLFVLLLGAQRSPAILLPSILVTPSVTNGIAAMPVQFNAAAATDGSPPVPITNYVWSFGDGSALVTNPAPAHVYVQPGIFTATLTGYGTNGVPYPGSLTQPIITSITLTATGAVFNVTGSITLTGVTSAFILTNGVMLAEAGSVSGQTVPVYAPVKLTATGTGTWSFSVSLNVPLTLTANATYSLWPPNPNVPSGPVNGFPGQPLFPSGPVGNYPSNPFMVEYNDGLGHTGVLIGNLGVLAEEP
jgi:PKD repeat protein